MSKTPAETHEYLVKLGIDRYRETFVRLFVREVAGQRVPGMAEMDPDETRAFFAQRTPEEWLQVAAQSPQAALNELRQFAEVS